RGRPALSYRRSTRVCPVVGREDFRGRLPRLRCGPMYKAMTPEDRFAIADLIARYGWALDTGDVDAFVACFAPDGAMIEQVFEDPDVWEGRDGIRRLAEHYKGIHNFPGRQHYCGNLLVTA